MKIIKLKKKNLEKIIHLTKDVLTADGLVVIPSDTVYGLAVKAASAKAVSQVLDFKGRQPDKGISVFLKNIEEIKDYALFSQRQNKVITSLLPGLFTVILNSKHRLARQLEASDQTLGIRIVDYKFINQLLRAVNFPITATSANISGKGPHYSIVSFLKTLSHRKKTLLDLVVDAGQLPKVPPSTVVRLIKENLEILREGRLNPRLILSQRTYGESETKKLAQEIYRQFWQKGLKEKAVIVLLQGDLGSGKTVFAQGIGEIFNQELVSPTFVLLDEYPINQKNINSLYHLDLYRIENETEIVDLKLEYFLLPGNLILIEWGEKLSVLNNLRKKGVVFFWLQIRTKAQKIRDLELYQL